MNGGPLGRYHRAPDAVVATRSALRMKHSLMMILYGVGNREAVSPYFLVLFKGMLGFSLLQK